jgi:hypothetical protein
VNVRVNQLQGSGASAQPQAYPTRDEVVAASNVLDYKIRGINFASAAAVNGAAETIRRAIANPQEGLDKNKLRALLTQAAQTPVASDNFAVATRIAAAVPLAAVDAFLAKFGPQPGLGESTRREIFGSMILELANQQNASLFEIARNFGLPANITGTRGVFDTFAKKASSAFGQEGIGQVFREQVQNKIGEFIAGIGQSVLNISNDIPLFVKFFLKPLGFTSQAQILKQLGNVLKGGSISDFDEKAVGLEAASTFKEAGQALATAAPFFPPPWNVAAGALAGLSIAAGKILNDSIRANEAARLAKQAEKDQAATLARAQVVVDDGLRFGRDAADYFYGGKQEPAEPVLRNAEEMQWFAQAARFAFVAHARDYGHEFAAQEAPRVVV